MQDIIKTDELPYKSKRRKTYNFGEYFNCYFFKRCTWRCSSLKDADYEQSKFADELKNINNGVKTSPKIAFSK